MMHAVLFLSFAAIFCRAHFYVCSNDGNDSNDGASASTPYATVAKLMMQGMKKQQKKKAQKKKTKNASLPANSSGTKCKIVGACTIVGEKDTDFIIVIIFFDLVVLLRYRRRSLWVEEGPLVLAFKNQFADVLDLWFRFLKRWIIAKFSLFLLTVFTDDEQIHFCRGGTFVSATLELTSKGANRGVLDAYGTGVAPVLIGSAGSVGLDLSNLSGWTVRDLEFRGLLQSGDTSCSLYGSCQVYGIRLGVLSAGNYGNHTLENVSVTNYPSGIFVGGPSVTDQMENIILRRVSVKDCPFRGISFAYEALSTSDQSMYRFQYHNVVLEDVTVQFIRGTLIDPNSGRGIDIARVEDLVVDRVQISHCGANNTMDSTFLMTLQVVQRGIVRDSLFQGQRAQVTSSYAVFVGSGIDNFVFERNLLYDCDGSGIAVKENQFAQPISNVQVRFNIIVNPVQYPGGCLASGCGAVFVYPIAGRTTALYVFNNHILMNTGVRPFAALYVDENFPPITVAMVFANNLVSMTTGPGMESVFAVQGPSSLFSLGNFTGNYYDLPVGYEAKIGGAQTTQTLDTNSHVGPPRGYFLSSMSVLDSIPNAAGTKTIAPNFRPSPATALVGRGVDLSAFLGGASSPSATADFYLSPLVTGTIGAAMDLATGQVACPGAFAGRCTCMGTVCTVFGDATFASGKAFTFSQGQQLVFTGKVTFQSGYTCTILVDGSAPVLPMSAPGAVVLEGVLRLLFQPSASAARRQQPVTVVPPTLAVIQSDTSVAGQFAVLEALVVSDNCTAITALQVPTPSSLSVTLVAQPSLEPGCPIPPGRSNGLSPGAIAGIVIGCVVVGVAIAVVVAVLSRHQQRQTNRFIMELEEKRFRADTVDQNKMSALRMSKQMSQKSV